MTAALRPATADSSFATRLFGRISVAPEAIISFADGLPGFAEARQFALLAAAAAGLYWLQSLDEPALAFLLVELRLIGEPVALLDGEQFAIVTLPATDRTATANLQAPVMVNRSTQQGRQLIRTDATPGTAVPIDLEALIRTT